MGSRSNSGRGPNERLLAEQLSKRHASTRHKRRAENVVKRKLTKKYMKMAKRYPEQFSKVAKQILGDDL